jgi:hypothetical protein
LVNIAQIAESSAVMTQVSVRAACEPSFNMRPGVLVGAAPRHDADVPSRNTIEFLVATCSSLSHLHWHKLSWALQSENSPASGDNEQVGIIQRIRPNVFKTSGPLFTLSSLI